MGDVDADYTHIRNGGSGFYETPRGLIAVWGKESVQFLDGMITNDVKTLGDEEQMLASFPNVQGRLMAVVRVLRQGDRFLIETEDATRQKVFQNLFRFTFAGDFFAEDLSKSYRYFEIFGAACAEAQFSFDNGHFTGCFVATDDAEKFVESLRERGAIRIDDALHETLRIESGVPRFGRDMDEATVVPELGLDGLISYQKGCYIGQEIIARIHFRGHVAKKLTGVVFDEWPNDSDEPPAATLELESKDGKPAGKITSVAFSPTLDRWIALSMVRYDYLGDGTRLLANGREVTVKALPFFTNLDKNPGL